jgi:hypothetical protein
MPWRTLYRTYLYLVLTLLLSFTAYATAQFLAAMFHASGLDGQVQSTFEPGNDSSQLTQAVALAVISWVVVLIFGGLHYWLIRRDIAADPGAAVGPVRSLFLNLNELGAGITTVVTGGVALTRIGTDEAYGASGLLGAAIAFGVLFALLELERRRVQPTRGGALVLQRLHFYGARLILLIVATFFWLDALNQTVARMLISTGSVADPCIEEQRFSNGACYIQTGQFLGNLWLAAVWTGVAWLGYGMLVRKDIASRPRQVLNFLGLAVGVVFVLDGIQRGAEVVLRGILGVPEVVLEPGSSQSAYFAATDRFSFVAPVALGVVVALSYLVWLVSDSRRGGPVDGTVMRQTALAVTAALTAFPFWYGCAELLDHLLERLGPHGTSPERAEWALALSLIVTGLAYIPLALLLSRQAHTTGVIAPRRGFVFTLLGLGTIAGTISLIVALYAVVTKALGAPVENAGQLARQAIANVVIGAVIAGIYVYLARTEGWFSRQQPVEGAPAPVAPATLTVESVLDDLLAGRLTRDDAAARIRGLASQTD